MANTIKAQLDLVIEHIRNNCLDYLPLNPSDYNLVGLWVLANNPNSMAADNYSLWLGERKLGTINLAEL